MRSGTVYVGNLSFYTSEEQIYELFSKCGTIQRIVMGLDRFKFTPCGFCFVIYSKPEEALNAVKYLGDTKLDDRNITIDIDPGFEDGRQFGRGKSGGQVSDELRFEYDASRGGFAIPFADRIGNNYDHQARPRHRRRRRHMPEAEVHAAADADADGEAADADVAAASDQEDNYVPE